MKIRYFSVLFIATLLPQARNGSPVVETPLGSVSGYTKISQKGRQFSIFEGIPYAKPPIGDRRFEEPEPIESWYGIWNATQPIICAQTGMDQPSNTIGDEDCLYINIYVPREKINSQENLEVIVDIHGGGYMYGNGHVYYDPKYIMDRELIFVTFNYRVGIFGFLSTEDDVVPGNMGLKDQIIALKWVQKNIASFGGNPDSVTLTGVSAGGASVHFHYLSQMSHGLFHRGVSHSGTALIPWALQDKALKKTRIVAESVGCPVSSNKVLIDCLKQRPTKQVLNAVGLLFTGKQVPIAPFAPVVENIPNGFLTADPYYLLKEGEIYDVPWLVSRTSHEGLPFIPISAEDIDNYNRNWDKVAPLYFDFTDTLDESLWANVSEKIRKFYFDDGEFTLDNVDNLVDAVTDRVFAVGIDKSVRMQAKVTKSSVYFYYFAYPGENSPTKYTMHGGDGRFWFGPVFDPSNPLTANELKLQDLLYNMLQTFIKTGTPVIEGVNWETVAEDQLIYLNVTNFDVRGMAVENKTQIVPEDFWNSLGFLEGENLLNGKDEL